MTTPDGVKVFIWIDTKGEVVVPIEELWWAAFASGARNVFGLVMEAADVWSRQSSVGML